MSSYADKLKDPRWQKKRLEILDKNDWCCQRCFDSELTLHVHHKAYIKGRSPWEYEDSELTVLCESCHENETASIKPVIDCFIRSIKGKFLSDQITDISSGFNSMPMVHTPGVIAQALEYTLSSEAEIVKLVENYFAHLRESNTK